MSHVLVRMAVPADATGISLLYEEAYTPKDGVGASEHYPFPQLLKPEWVEQTISDAWIHWVIAERAGQIVGSAAAVRNIGSEDDRVAELFGIVVKRKERGAGIAKRLLTTLCKGLGDEPQFILCESRTAFVAAWKVALACGFLPLGFEPFAHRTPAGSEAMLLTGRIQAHAMEARIKNNALFAPVHSLAEAVLADRTPQGTIDSASAPYPLHAQSWSDLIPFCHLLPAIQSAPTPDPLSPVTVSRNDRHGHEFIERSGADNRHRSGVIALKRFEGSRPNRYDRQYHVVHGAQQPLAAALVVYDRVDQRARLLDLRTTYDGLQGVLLAGVIAALTKQASDHRMTVVIDVCADATRLQQALFELGFRPTIYYPSFVSRGDGRMDGIQYTLLHNGEFEDSLTFLEKLDWLSATQVVRAVQKNFLSGESGMHNTH